MFINATTRQQISIYAIGPLLIFACLYPPLLEKWGVDKFFFARDSVLYPLLKIRGAVPDHAPSKDENTRQLSDYAHQQRNRKNNYSATFATPFIP